MFGIRISNVTYKRILLSIGVGIFGLTLAGLFKYNLSVRADTNPTEWNMAGANPARTSWITESVNVTGIDWYRPIEAYIDQETQIVTGNGHAYISTSKGLIVLNAETGALAWRFDTEMPLGHSPTIVGDMVYVAGFDHKLYGIRDNGSSYTLVWTFSGAGLGYSANPVVVNGRVFIGNRDGYFYAVDADDGSLEWQYPQANSTPLGPIAMSPAYSAATGDLYFVSQDMYAYALDGISGTLVWKSAAKLPGERYQSWWPVIWGDKVVFSGAFAYKRSTNPGTASVGSADNAHDLQSLAFFNNSLTGTGYIGATSTSNGTQGWTSGTSLLDTTTPANVAYDSLDSYTTEFPERRTVVVLDQSSGTESVSAPFMFEGTTSGNRYPPVINPADDTAYIQNWYWQASGNIGRKAIMGWKLGNQYLSVNGNHQAWDEPGAISGMGTSSLMYNLCCDRDAHVVGGVGFWNYPATLDGILPAVDGEADEYDPMWRFYTTSDDLERLKGYYKGNISSRNGVYNSHGLQNPLVPYAFTNQASQRVERMFTHRSNTIIALGSTGSETSLALIPIENNPTNLAAGISASRMQSMLENEIDKIIDVYEADTVNGFLKPGYYNHGSLGGIGQFPNFYFENPADTLLSLSLAYPHVNSTMQTRLRTYLDAFYNKYFVSSAIRKIGWSTGVAREDMDYPADIETAMSSLNNLTTGAYSQRAFYALWKYAEIINDQATALTIYNTNSINLQVPSNLESSGANTHVRTPYVYNEYIVGYTGFLNLQQLAFGGTYSSGAQTTRNNVTAELAALLAYRNDNFTKDHPIRATGDNPTGITMNHYYRNFNFSRNFLYLVPELGEYMETNMLIETEEAINEYTYLGPYWFVSPNENTFQEGVMHNLYDSPSLFSAKAYVLGDTQEELSKYIDSPTFQRGDLFFINNLSIALDATTTSNPTTSDPLFSPGAGTFYDTTEVAISSTTPGAEIYYTADGSTPSQSSTLYSGPIAVTTTTTLRARAYATGYDPSNITSATFTITVPDPILTPSGGTYANSVDVDVNPVNSAVTMYYTTDGSTPDETDSVFSQGIITFTQTTTFKIRSLLSGNWSSTVTGTYTITTSSANNPPVANAQIATAVINTPKNILLSFSDADGPGPYVTEIVSNPSQGILANMGDSDDKTWTYTPTANYTGADSFSWRVSDGGDNSTTVVVNITVVAAQTGNIVIDHNMVNNLFDDLIADTAMLATLRTKRANFKHASVGANIWDGLKCMGENYTTRPNYCDVDEDPLVSSYYHNPAFSIDFDNDGDLYDDVSFYFHNETPVYQNPGNPNPAWYDKVSLFIDGMTSRESSNPFDVYGFKIGYVDGASGNNIANQFFNSASSYTNISDVEAVEAAYPSKKVVYWTMGLSRTIGTDESTSFNTQMRAYTQANNKILMDIADIESHLDDGTHCLNADGSGNEVMCDEYTSEVNGGHLNGAAKSKAAKGFWLMMACANGWSTCTAGSVDSNLAPEVFAGVDRTINIATSPDLDGAAVDDGMPANPGELSYTWSKVSGPGAANFSSTTTPDASVTFTLGGTYVLRLSVTDGELTTTDQVTIIVEAANVTPTAAFTADVTTGTAPVTVIFDASSSSDTDGTIASYAWDFGDTTSGSGVNPTHTFSAAGTFTVTLTVTDNDGGTDTDTEVITVSAGASDPVIDNVMHSGTGSKFTKYEIIFDLTSDVTDLNPYLPFIDTTDAAAIAGVDSYADKGISVSGTFQYKGLDGTLTGQPVYTVPAFYYTDYTYTSAKNVTGSNWLYPNGNYGWKLRYAPDLAGVWAFTITATDTNGSATTSSDTFTVADNSKKGFIKVSANDSKYFEYENGDLFKGLGYHVNLSDSDAITDSATVATDMGSNGMDLARFWLSGWSIFGGAWSPPYNELSYEDGYLPLQTFTANQHDSDSEISIRMGYYADGNPGTTPMCLVYGWQSPRIAVEPSTNYRFTLKYLTDSITNSGTGGLIVKTASWIDLDRNTCTNPANGTAITSYVNGTSTGWETTTGEITTTGGQNYLNNLYITLDNVTGGTAYIDSLIIEKLDGPGGNAVLQVNPDYSADYHTQYNQRDAYAFDKVVENFESQNVALKVVVMEKMDKISRQFGSDGNWAASPIQNNVYGNTSSPRSDTKVRWLQKAWWRYLQARWGYSPSIHSFELLNEGDPASGTHFALADEFGKYFKCSVFGASVGTGNGQMCSYDHPNKHMVTTSTWHSFPNLWSSANYPNLDYADIHQYVPATYSSYVDNIVYDSYRYYIQQAQPALSSIDLGNSSIRSYTKPIIRGETGFTTTDTSPYQPLFDADVTGLWLHDFIWGQLNFGAIMEQYWYSDQQISSQTIDFNANFAAYSKFLDEEPLNDGGYSEINFSNTSTTTTGQSVPHPRYEQNPTPLTTVGDMDDVIITGLKNVAAGRAALWIKNVHNNWCVATGLNTSGSGEVCEDEPDNTSVPYNFNVVLSGFTPNTTYTLEKWDTWNAWSSSRAEQILETTSVDSDSSGNVTMGITSLTTEVAYKLLEDGPVTNTDPVAAFTQDLTSGVAPLVVNFDASGSSDSDGTIVTYAWDFGDSSSGSGATVAHTFSVEGSYTVTLTVTDNEGGTNTATVGISVSQPPVNQTPIASFTSSATSGTIPLEIDFDGTDSSDPDGTLASYLWNFGDGTTATGSTTTHTYTTADSYVVRLTVTDNDGAPHYMESTITANPLPNVSPSASFVASVASGVAPLTVNFDGTASSDSDGNIILYTWDFGDGSGTTGSTSTNIYEAAGTYTVRLTVTDNDDATHYTTSNIQVTAAPANSLPSATFTMVPSSGTVPLNVSFNASDSNDSDGSVVSYAWDFGDGTTATGVSSSHLFNNAGTFTVRLTVTDDDGGTNYMESNVVTTDPVNIQPIASFFASPSSGDIPLRVVFDGRDSRDTDGSIAGYGWVYGDGSTAGGATSVKYYYTAGTYTVRLTVTDNDGSTHEVSANITANQPGSTSNTGTTSTASTTPTPTLTPSEQVSISGEPTGTVNEENQTPSPVEFDAAQSNEVKPTLRPVNPAQAQKDKDTNNVIAIIGSTIGAGGLGMIIKLIVNALRNRVQ